MMLKRELLRLGLCAAAGLVIGLLCAGLKAMVPCAFYAVGLFYGIRFVLPALLGALKTFANAGILSIVFKNPIGILVLALLCLLVVSVIIAVAWVAGVVFAAIRLWRAWQADRAMGTPFQPRFPPSGRSRPKAGSGAQAPGGGDASGWDASGWDSGGDGGWNSGGWDD